MNVDIYPFQIAGAVELYERKRTLLADEPGMFKTSQTIFEINLIEDDRGKPIQTLVTCPYAVQEHWVKEFSQWHEGDGEATIFDMRKFDKSLKKARQSNLIITAFPAMSAISKDKRLKKLLDMEPDLYVIDEVHNAKILKHTARVPYKL